MSDAAGGGGNPDGGTITANEINEPAGGNPMQKAYDNANNYAHTDVDGGRASPVAAFTPTDGSPPPRAVAADSKHPLAQLAEEAVNIVLDTVENAVSVARTGQGKENHRSATFREIFGGGKGREVDITEVPESELSRLSPMETPAADRERAQARKAETGKDGGKSLPKG